MSEEKKNKDYRKVLPEPFDINEAAGYLCKGHSFFFSIKSELIVLKDLYKDNEIKKFAESILSFINAKDEVSKLKEAEKVIRQTIGIQCNCLIYASSDYTGNLAYVTNWGSTIGILSFVGAILTKTSPENSRIALAAELWHRMGHCDFLYNLSYSHCKTTIRDHLQKDERRIGDKLLLEAAKILVDGHIPLNKRIVNFLKDSVDCSQNKVKETGCSLSSFFNQIDLTLPGLKRVKSAFEKGNLKEARNLYTAYLSERCAKKGWTMDKNKPRANKRVLAEADDICKNIFILRGHNYKEHDFGKKVDWVKLVDNNIENRAWMNSHSWMQQLVAAYEETGKEKYVRHLCRLFHSWYKNGPVTFSQGTAQWHPLRTGSRIMKWSSVLFSLAKHPLFCKKVLFDMACSALDHAKYLICFGIGRGNWEQVEASGLGYVSALFPEFKLSSLFYLTAVRRLIEINKYAFLPDGFQSECSIGYHMLPLSTNLNFYRLAQHQRKYIPQDLTTACKKALKAITRIAYPDFTLPLLSDCGPRRSSVLEVVTPAVPHIFKREDFKWFATKRKDGKPPQETSYNFKDAGYCVMRDSWRKDAQCLIFDAGYFGKAHQHEDKLNFVLFAGGRELIGDPGIYSYQGEFIPYWKGSWGHNVVIIDKKTQARRTSKTPEPIPDPHKVFIMRKNFDFAVGWYKDGYSFNPLTDKPDKNVQHQRCIFYLKGKYIILCDRILGKKKRDIELLFHLAPIVTGEKVRPVSIKIREDKTVVTTESKYANVAVIPGEKENWNVQDIIGQKNPIRGWYALYGCQPSHDIVYHREDIVPLHFETVIQPLAVGETDVLEVKSFAIEEKNIAILEISGNGRNDIFLFSYEAPSLIKYKDITFKGMGLLLERNNKKVISGIHLIKGKYLKYEGRIFIDKEKGETVTLGKVCFY